MHPHEIKDTIALGNDSTAMFVSLGTRWITITLECHLHCCPFFCWYWYPATWRSCRLMMFSALLCFDLLLNKDLESGRMYVSIIVLQCICQTDFIIFLHHNQKSRDLQKSAKTKEMINRVPNPGITNYGDKGIWTPGLLHAKQTWYPYTISPLLIPRGGTNIMDFKISLFGTEKRSSYRDAKNSSMQRSMCTILW